MRLSTLLLFGVIGIHAVAATDPIDALLAERLAAWGTPGASLAVVREGDIIKEAAYGVAQLEHAVPVTFDTVFEIGSLTKQFTAVAMLLLVQDHKISLDEPLRDHLLGTPENWAGITLRHLLTHTSGIPDYLSVPGLFAATTRRSMNHTAIADLFFARLQPEFAPGESWAYSNTGYLLLGNVIEAVSGRDYWSFLQERIFGPLGMKSTRGSHPATLIPYRSSGYGREQGRLENRAALTGNAYAAGSIVSTARDLARWSSGWSELLDAARLDEAWTAQRRADGGPLPFNYGLGWFVDSHRGHRLAAHHGTTPGFASALFHFEPQQLTVILLTNDADRVLDQLAMEIAGHYAEELRPSESPDPDPAFTDELRDLLPRMGTDTLPRQRFTSAQQIFLRTATGQETWAWVLADGALADLTFLEQERTGAETVRRYRARLGETPRLFTVVLSDEEKIAQIRWW